MYKLSCPEALAAGVLVGAGLVTGCGSNAAPAPLETEQTNVSPSPATGPTVFVPAWLDDVHCNKLTATIPKGAAGRVIIAFALPTADRGVTAPAISPACGRMIQQIGASGDISLSIGGYGASDTDHQAILNGWNAAVARPDVFAASTAAAVQNVSADIGQTVNGVDIDWEYPTTHQEITDLGKTLLAVRRKVPPDTQISLDVPAEGWQVSARPLADMVDKFNIMTYDKSGSWSEVAGDIAPASWTISCIKDWVRQVGDPSKVVVGFPDYGYTFIGARKRGDHFRSVQTTYLDVDISPSAITDPHGDVEAAEAIVNGSWTSLVTPAEMQHTYAQLLRLYPKLGGAMLWSVQNSTPQHYTALRVLQ